jgi:DNA-binding NarL/FixJ family response regulator
VITVLIVGNEPIPRSALTHLLMSEPDIRVLDEGDEKCAADKIVALKPSVVLFHVPVLRSDFVPVISSIAQSNPGMGIAILGREMQAQYLGQVLAAGASGFVLLGATPNNLFGAIRAAARRRRFIGPSLSNQLLEYFADKANGKTQELSRRERQVLKMFAQGHTLKEIAEFLGLGRRSIETYQLRVRRKLRLRTRAELVRYALETGILR